MDVASARAEGGRGVLLLYQQINSSPSRGARRADLSRQGIGATTAAGRAQSEGSGLSYCHWMPGKVCRHKKPRTWRGF